MNNQTLQIKLKQRLNKLASNDYDNIECWQIVEAFNKAQVEWVRRQLHGNNLYREGDEMSKRRIDDLQILLEETNLPGSQQDNYFESSSIPANYMEYKRVTAYATSECCPDPRSMTVYLSEEANVNLIMRDPLKRPDYEWGETFCTWLGNNVRVYRREFDITDKTEWLESSEDNPIINVIQREYPNNDIEIVIKKKLTTDYVKIMLRNGKKIIRKETKANNV